MDTLQRTKEILADAEKALAGLASEAAKEAHYEVASCLIDSAREVNSLAVRTIQRLGDGAPEKMQLALEADKTDTLSVIPVRLRGRGKVRKNAYPRFVRQGNQLVKIGWSSSKKAEYEHKCPRKVLTLLASAISKAGANGKRFAMDRVLPLLDPADGARVPDYQAYLCLAWLGELGIVTQHGRQGYSLASKNPLEPLIESRWGSLAVR